MTTHKPNNFDIVCDLHRCIYSSLSTEGFKDSNFSVFWNLAKKNLNIIKETIDSKTFNNIKRELKLATSKDIEINHRREHILNASVILQSL